MSYYEKIMQKAFEKANMQYGQYCEGDYYKEQDGFQILHCKQCGEAKQQIRFISLWSHQELEAIKEQYALQHRDLSEQEVEKDVMSKIPPKNKRRDLGLVGVPCKCQRDVRAGITRQEKNQERRRTIQDNTINCFPAYTMRLDTYDRYESNYFIKKVQGYAKKWAQMKKENKGLFLCGPSGSGKTVAAICLANDLLQREVKVLFKIQPEIIGEAQADINNKQIYINMLIHDCGLLVIDDLNLDVLNTGGREILFQIIDGRIQARKPMVITSNIRKSALLERDSGEERHILERLNDACYLLENSEHNYRQKPWCQ